MRKQFCFNMKERSTCKENVMYITGISQAVLELLSFKVGSGNHQGESPSKIFGNLW